jgi:predicted 3-demethylubiquinone-9 3-methyltransferase (glyoxalase superfamily)
VKNASTEEEIENFWKAIFGKKVQHNKAYWIKNQY